MSSYRFTGKNLGGDNYLPADAPYENIYHLKKNGAFAKVENIPQLSAGEGVFAYSGEMFIKPLELRIEFIQSADARQWLCALLLRHIERVRSLNAEITAYAEIKE